MADPLSVVLAALVKISSGDVKTLQEKTDAFTREITTEEARAQMPTPPSSNSKATPTSATPSG